MLSRGAGLETILAVLMGSHPLLLWLRSARGVEVNVNLTGVTKRGSTDREHGFSW
jgi:hypothetical protein